MNLDRRPARFRFATVPRLAVVAACALGLWASGCASPSAPRIAAPKIDNVVVILIDTLRSDHLPSYGYSRDTAPFLQRLSNEGIQLQGYSVSSWTKPSVASLFTGIAPQRHQAISRTDVLPDAVPYLPELLSRQGFTTSTFIGNRNSGRKFGFGRGFDHYEQSPSTSKVEGARITDAVFPMMEDLASRFFLYVHYVDPHDPYNPAQPWIEEGGEEEWAYVQPGHIYKGFEEATPLNLRRMVDQYDGEIVEVDEEIRRLLEGLDQRGLLERTLVVITSDHGEEFFEHGGLTHGNTLYNEVLEVPFILWMKGGELPSYTSSDRFFQIDFLPTLLEALGLQVAELGEENALDGASRWRQLLSGEPPHRGTSYFHLDLDETGSLASLEGSTKLVHALEEPHDRLFNLEEDPQELRPTTALTGSSVELRRALLSHHNRMGILSTQRRIEDLDDETRKSLAALGYLEVNTPEEELRHRHIPPRLDRDRGFRALDTPPPGGPPPSP